MIEFSGKYAMLCDGKTRPLGRQKKKNVIHIRETVQTVSLEEVVTDKALRKVLHPLNYPKQHR